MITTPDWERVVCKLPFSRSEQKSIDKIIGLDTETYITGVPFMFCTWDPERNHSYHFTLQDLPDILFTEQYVNANFVLWNLKFDGGSILQFLTKNQMHILWELGEITIPYKDSDLKLKYIPHKLLRITCGKNHVCFWDICQYYASSLEKAASTYLNEHKHDMRTKKFTPQYVEKHFNKIRDYCIQDSRLTALLGVYLVNKLKEVEIETPSLYSCASIAFKYFSDRSKIVPGARWIDTCPELLKMACDAYEGGKFEITARGHFGHGFEYDLSSAYPYEIANLVDLTNSRIMFSNRYQKFAVYGFIRCRIHNPKGLHLPCGIMEDKRIYPAGTYYLTITKKEYEYITSIGVDVTILKAVWVFVERRQKLYYEEIMYLYRLKSESKGKDKMAYLLYKILQNSFYGKFCQVIEDNEKQLITGAGWNPIYAAEITANTRIKVARKQNELQENCLGVHTDSIITLCPIPAEQITGALGEYALEKEGEGLIVASGQYDMSGKSAFKGFEPEETRCDSLKACSHKRNLACYSICRSHSYCKDQHDVQWKNLLTKYKYRSKFGAKFIHVESWLESMAKGHFDMVNVFFPDKKQVDLNVDTKRLWAKKVRGIDLLSGLEYSKPRFVEELQPPSFW